LRWEFKHPVPFLRSREFLWNEGHTVFASQKEAEMEEKQIMDIYKEICENYLALPGYIGLKTDKEKFAGALYTVSIEHLMPNGKAIQGPDFHHDGQNFAKAFGIQFLDENEKKQYAWQNTFAISTREIGVMLAVHGDEKGFIIPPKVAPEKAVIVPIFKQDSREKVLKKTLEVARKLPDIIIDSREDYSPGAKFHEWEKKGVPLRIEIGPKDLEANRVIFVRRDTGEKKPVSMSKIKEEFTETLEDIQKSLFKRAEKKLKDNTRMARNYTEFKEALNKGGFVQACWCGSRACEDKIKEETGAKITNLPYEFQKKVFSPTCICGAKTKHVAHWAKSY
jgi:prolyl-tRNA synthetase